jgi:hypothetical protein
LVSTGSESLAAVTPALQEYPEGPRLSFLILVENRASEAIDVSESNVAAFANGRAAQVVSAADLMREVQDRAKWAAVSAALSGAADQMNAANAGRSTTSGTTTASAYGSGGYAQGTGTYNSTTYDPYKAQMAQAQAQQQTNSAISSIVQNRNSETQKIQASALQRTTVVPGGSVLGEVTIEVPSRKTKSSQIRLLVTVGSDVHEFSFQELPVP